MPAAWAATAVAEFGRQAKTQLAGPGDREAAIRKPVEGLLAATGAELHMTAVFYDEVRLADRQVRPDYAVAVDGVTTGYVEIKAPQRSIDPDVFRGHDRVQWERQRDLPNLVYTNGTEWRLYRDGAAVGEPVSMSGGPLDSAGSGLQAGDDLEALLTDFLRWHPAPITSVVGRRRSPWSSGIRRTGSAPRAMAGGSNGAIRSTALPRCSRPSGNPATGCASTS